MKKGLAPRRFGEPGFTLMEILIVVSLLVLLAAAFLLLINPFSQINKSQDSKRKSELSSFNKVLEDWYNDKNCYPKVEEVCYDSADSNNSCHICGTESTSPSFSPYLSKLPCDPLHPSKRYLYQTDGSSCPGWYIAYTNLSNDKDLAITEIGCQNGCGPIGNLNYNYFVSSSNIILEGGIGPTSSVPVPTSTPTISSAPVSPTATPGVTNNPTSTPIPPTLTPTPPVSSGQPCSSYQSLYILYNGCQICGSYVQCQQNNPGQIYYIDPGGPGYNGCSIACVKD